MKAITIVLALALGVFAVSPAVAQQQTEDPKLPSIRIVLFTPKGVVPPPRAEERLTQVARYAEDFFVKWMTHWGYEPARKEIFQWKPDGNVEVLFAKGDQPPEHYTDGSFRPKMMQQLAREHKIPRNNNINWVFVYKGDPPARFANFKGSGNSKTGGWAMANFLSTPGEISIEKEIAAGFHDDFSLKGVIHEFGHGLGLPHLGPRMKDNFGNTLMGPVTRIWRQELGKDDPRGYLSEGSAAMLWKHPIFTGTTKDRRRMPVVSLDAYRASFDARNGEIEIRGKVTSDINVHSVVVVDDMRKKPGEYWVRPYVGRVNENGIFEVTINEPVDSGGTYKLVFCCDNGVVTGDGKKHGLQSAIEKKYSYARGVYRFD